jgi:hypothetical protein
MKTYKDHTDTLQREFLRSIKMKETVSSSWIANFVKYDSSPNKEFKDYLKNNGLI